MIQKIILDFLHSLDLKREIKCIQDAIEIASPNDIFPPTETPLNSPKDWESYKPLMQKADSVQLQKRFYIGLGSDKEVVLTTVHTIVLLEGETHNRLGFIAEAQTLHFAQPDFFDQLKAYL